MHIKNKHPTIHKKHIGKALDIPQLIEKHHTEVEQQKKERETHLYLWKCEYCNASGRKFVEYQDAKEYLQNHMLQNHKEISDYRLIFLKKPIMHTKNIKLKIVKPSQDIIIKPTTKACTP